MSFQLRLSRRLLAWAAASVAGGLILAVFGSGFWRGFGIQAAAWGAVDALIALLGRWSALRRSKAPGGAQPDEDERRSLKAEGRRLRRILWINAGLDVLYVGGGLILALTLGKSSTAALGHAVGILVQGAFLLLFDVIHAQAVPPPPPRPFHAFQDPVHQSFRMSGGAPGALLVHGFPGTPAEMRPLGRLLHREGWTVRGLLLPGFGAEFPGLLSMPQERWRDAVAGALAELRREHSPVLLVGYSLGAALALAAARAEAPDALLLLAPFWRLGTGLQRAAGVLLRPFLPQYLRLFADADFRDPELRRSLGDFFPDANLDDREFQEEIRELVVPLSLLGRLVRAGRQAYRAAGESSAPILVVQGSQDRLALPEHTRRLAARLGRPGDGRSPLVEIPAGHRLLDEDSPAWISLAETVTRFAGSVAQADRPRADRETAS